MANGNSDVAFDLEREIEAWRTHLRRSRAISAGDAMELEDHLREQIENLSSDGLSEDEAFLVAVRRMGAIDSLTREFAREHSERLWKQLLLTAGTPGIEDVADEGASRRMWVALALAVAAAVSTKIAMLLLPAEGIDVFFLQNAAFFVLPFIAMYFAWDRPLPSRGRAALVAVFALACIAVNVFPFTPDPGADTQVLTGIHLPIFLWFAVGVAYVGGAWRGSDRRMDFVRFTGEMFIYYVLIALGGGVLIATTFGLFEAIGIDAEPMVENWIIPFGVPGAALVAMWLVEAKQSVIENMAPVLSRIFTPLFALVFLAFLVTMAATGRGFDVERDILIAFDLLLVVVFGLLLYAVSARDPLERPGLFDWTQLALVVTALFVDGLALWAIGSRISDFGFTPNRVAALGENLVLLVNLAGSAVLYAGFVRGRVVFSRLLAWQTTYLYVLAGWAAIVAFVFPFIFGFR